MNFELTENQLHWRQRVEDFLAVHVEPRHQDYLLEKKTGARWKVLEVLETLKDQAGAAGLWNLFMPPAPHITPLDSSFTFAGPQLSNLEYALCAEAMGRIRWSPEVFNCSAPDTGNMEILHRFGTAEQKQRWLAPLMHGKIRSAFLMTEPAVASSDATNIETNIQAEGDNYILNGRKWWSSGIGDPRCQLAIVMAKGDPNAPKHQQQSMILVPLDLPGIKVERMLTVFGYDDAPHGHAEVVLDNVIVPKSNILLGEGRGFEIAQGRLGPGRIHHCMRALGTAEAALEAMVRRLQSRTAFGKRLAQHGVWDERVAQARIEIEMTRLLCLRAADTMDRKGNKAAHVDISMIKVQAPRMALQIIDDAIQAHGGAGVCQDFELASSWAALRSLRIADGPDEVHRRQIARAEYGRYPEYTRK